MTTHLVIPDTQISKGVPTEFLSWIGQYIVDKRPDKIIQLGDFADMHSLSSYDQGKRAGEGARFQEDIVAAREAMTTLLSPLEELNERLRNAKQKQYRPEMHLLLGNHEYRIERHVDNYPVLEGILSTDSLGYSDFGWTVHRFLEVVTLDGVQYSHFFPRGPNGRVMQSRNGAPNAKLQAQREMVSSTAGHTQGLDFHIHQTGNRLIYSMIAGSCYQHEEDYLTPQGTKYWRGIILKQDVHEGEYAPIFIDLGYLERRYGK